MNAFNKNVSGHNKGQYEKVLTQSLERDKRQKEQAPSSNDEPLIFSGVVGAFRKLLAPILSHAQSSIKLSETTNSLLSGLRKLLTKLAQEDCSHKPDFNQQMAALWHTLIDDCNQMTPKDPGAAAILKKEKFLLSQISNYPVGADYTLGHYLVQELGSEWNPFPCMQLFKKLHDEFSASPTHSTLHNWILLIDNLRAH